MRGRTNAGNGGIFLNATTDSFEVASGNITAGDFVEYYYDTTEKELSGSIINNSKSYPVGENTGLYMALVNSIPTLYKWVDGLITIVDTYSYTATTLFPYNGTTFLAGNYVLSVDVNQEELSLISSSNYTFTAKLNDNILISLNASGHLYTLNCTDLANISLMSSISSVSGVFICAYNNVVYTLWGTTSTYGRLYLTPWEVNTETGEITKVTNIEIASTGSSASAVANRQYPLSSVILANRYVVFAYTFFGSATTAKTICVFDLVEKRKAVSTLLEILNSVNIGDISSSDIDNNGYIIIAEKATGGITEKAVALFRFNPANQTLTKLSSLALDNNYSAVFKRSSNSYSLHTNDSYMELTNTNNVLSIGELTNTVKEWAGSGNPLGVAKQTGSAGSTIEVYIPSVNV